MEITVSPKQEGDKYHRKECLNRACDHCGVNRLDTLYEPISAAHAAEEHEVVNMETLGECRILSTRKTAINSKDSPNKNYEKLIINKDIHE